MLNDTIGFAAVFAAGYYVRGVNASSLQWYDVAIVLGLLAIGFYFAVLLS